MALLFMDGCDIYGTSSALLAQRYNRLHGVVDANFAPAATGGRFGEGVINITAEPARQLVKMLDAPQGGASAPANTEIFFGFYFRMSALPSAATRAIAYLLGEAGGKPLVVCVTTSGTLQLRASSTTGTQFGSTGATVLAANTWYWLTVRFRGVVTTGVADLRIGNVAEITFTGTTNTVAENVWGVGLVGGQLSPSITHSFDDFFIWNNQTGWPTTWIPAQRIDLLLPDGQDGQWFESYFSTSTSAHGATNIIGEADQNTTFIDIEGSGRIVMPMDNLAVAPPGAINVVNVGAFVANTGSLQKNVNMMCRIQNGQAESSQVFLNLAPSVYGIISAPFFTNPHTASAWTATPINSHLQAGVRVTRPTAINPGGTQRFGFSPGNLPSLSSVQVIYANEMDVSVYDYPYGQEREVDRIFFTPTQTLAGYNGRALIYDVSPETGLPVNLLGISNQTTGATSGTEMQFVFPHTVPVFPDRKYALGLWSDNALTANSAGQNSMFYTTFAYSSTGFPTADQPDFRYSTGSLVPLVAQALLPASRAGGTYRFWRVRIPHTAVPSATYVELRELEFRTSVGGADAANGGQPLASSIFSTTYPAWNAFNNSTADTWASTTYTSGSQWVGYLFPASVALAQIVWSNYSSTTAAPSEFFVDRSDDGVTWTQTNVFSGLSWTSDEVKTFNL